MVVAKVKDDNDYWFFIHPIQHFPTSDYSISLLLLAKSSIPTSIRGDSSSAISVKFELYAFDAELQKKIIQILFTQTIWWKKTDSVLASENAPIKSSKTAKCPHSHSHRSGPCLFAGSLRVSFWRCLPYLSSPRYRSTQGATLNGCQRFKQPNSLLACLS